MGNCCKPASSMEWGGEDWSFLMSNSKNTSSNKVFNEADHGHGLSLRKVQKEKLVAALRASCSVANGTFKVKISKKELADLLENQQQVNKKQVGQASAEQVLLRLMKARDHDPRDRLWRPLLESIPEVTDSEGFSRQ